MNKKLSRNLSLGLIIALTSTSMSFAAANYQYTPSTADYQNYSQYQNYQQNYYQPTYNAPKQQVRGKQPTTLKGRVVTVPAGVPMQAVVATPISSEYLTTGQQVTLTLGSDFYYNSTLIAPAGSSVIGNVTQARKAKFGTVNGLLKLKFTQIITPYGSRIPISAIIKTSDNTGTLVGGTKMDVTKSYAKNLAIGSAVGALAGTIFGPISGGQVGRGAALGTAVGAVGGLGKSAITKGTNVEIPAGSTVQLTIDQPITVNPVSYNYEY